SRPRVAAVTAAAWATWAAWAVTKIKCSVGAVRRKSSHQPSLREAQLRHGRRARRYTEKSRARLEAIPASFFVRKHQGCSNAPCHSVISLVPAGAMQRDAALNPRDAGATIL